MTDAEREVVRKLLEACDALVAAFSPLLPRTEDIGDEQQAQAAKEAVAMLSSAIGEVRAIWHPRPEPS
jgi:hypothetical protein